MLLNAIGYENEVNYALNDAETGFSAEADALIEAIVARLAAMTEEERAAFEALLQQYFPMTKLTRGSQEYDYVEFTLEIRVRLEDGYRLERYGFRLTDGVWTLASISVARRGPLKTAAPIADGRTALTKRGGGFAVSPPAGTARARSSRPRHACRPSLRPEIAFAFPPAVME